MILKDNTGAFVCFQFVPIIYPPPPFGLSTVSHVSGTIRVLFFNHSSHSFCTFKNHKPALSDIFGMNIKSHTYLSNVKS